MTEQEEKLLMNNGWMVECDNPLEIRHIATNEYLCGKEAKEFLKKMKKGS